MSHAVRSDDAAAVSLVARSFDHPDAERLLSAYARERRLVVGFDDPPHSDTPYEYEPPRGLFLVAYRHDTDVVACGGYRSRPERDGIAEIRKMFVVPRYRKQGLGPLLLASLEKRAAAHGAEEVVLETGSYNTTAIRMYRSAGYQPIAPYVPGRPSFNRAFAKKLSSSIRTERQGRHTHRNAPTA